MECLLIELIVLVLLLNIRAIVVLIQNKQRREELSEDAALIHQGMEEFVEKIEKENEELYQKLADYIKVKEDKFEKRIRLLEKQLAAGRTDAPEPPEVSEKQETGPLFAGAGSHQEQVSKLHKQGFAPKQIAKVLKMEHGEVELIVNMLKKKKSYQK
ncbi:DUF6115 domain-containing protein [Planococcus ruber]|uniref:DUF6115 domain-containing protein n=1 Tax=Planococcus ruber TaxID=2027871 RepID=UPI001FEF51D1|nr:hypothetical protein [Planococcus ruber]MCJ1909748.1 hypothetical protein [Planococcus ruber]